MSASSIKVGEYNVLRIARAFDFGLYLGEGKDVVPAKIIDDLLLLDDCSETSEWANQIQYLPFR